MHSFICFSLHSYHIHQGHNVNTGMSSSTVDQILGDIIPEGSLGISSRTTAERDLPPGYLEELSTSKYVSTVACQTDEERDHQQSPDQRHLHSSQAGLPKQCSVDLAAVLEHQRLRIGKGGYSKNMTEVQCKNKCYGQNYIYEHSLKTSCWED